MHFLHSIFPEELVEGVGWALFHSIWQGALVTIVLVGLLYFLKNFSSQVRYLIACSALVITFVWAVFTGISAYKYAHEKRIMREALVHHPNQVIELISHKLQDAPPIQEQKDLAMKIKWLKFRAIMQRNFPIIFGLWFIGVLLFLLRMTGGVIYQIRMRRKSVIPLEKYWQEKVDAFASKLGIRKKIRAIRSRLSQMPMISGHRKPLLLIPVIFFTGLSEEELEAVIAHELAHIKRYDYLINIIQSVIETFFFYHPAVWMISKIIRNEREHSCDDLAVELTGNKVAYIKALAASQELFTPTSQRYALAFSSSKKGALLHRVNRIKNHKTMKNKTNEGFFAATLLFISLVLVSFTIDSQGLKDGSLLPGTIDQPNTKAIAPSSIKNKPISMQHASKIKQDSITKAIQQSAEKLKAIPPEMEQLMEIAYTQNNAVLSQQVAHSIDSAVKQVNMDLIMHHVDSVITSLNINQIIQKSMSDSALKTASQGNEISRAALETARAALNNVNVNQIVKESLEQTKTALDNIDLQGIINEALEASKTAIQEQKCKTQQEIKQEKATKKAVQEALEQARKDKNNAQDLKSKSDSAKLKAMEDQLDKLEK